MSKLFMSTHSKDRQVPSTICFVCRKPTKSVKGKIKGEPVCDECYND